MTSKATSIAPELRETWFPSHYNSDFRNSPDTLWLKLTPKTFRPDINVQTNTNTGTTAPEASLHFLMPKSFTFGVDHTWADLTTIAGQIREVKSGFELAAAQLSGFTGVEVASAYGRGETRKNDNPYVYENSSRRKLSLQFEFGAYRDAKYEVWNPIQSLILWSSADKVGDRIDTTVKFPYVFRLQTVNGKGREIDLIKIENACIDSVMPNYEEPYRNGYPMKASVTVNFTDINPTYRSSIKTGGATISTGTE